MDRFDNDHRRFGGGCHGSDGRRTEEVLQKIHGKGFDGRGSMCLRMEENGRMNNK
jgi:hypothetical protein